MSRTLKLEKMRNIKLMIILFLLCGFTTVYSQETSSAKDNTVTLSSNEIVDPKLSPEEQSQIQNAGQDNPAKIDESQMVDPKMESSEIPTEEDFGQSNAKSEPLKDLKMVNAPATKTTTVQKETENQSVQPKGEKADHVVNYRNMNGPNTQPKGEKAGSVTNYRDINGPNTQPLPTVTKDPEKLN